MALDSNTALTFAENIAPDIGVDVSTFFGLRQTIYADRSSQQSTRQAIYADRSYIAPMRQIITADEYVSVKYDYSMKQTIYSEVLTHTGMRQSIYADRSYSYPILVSMQGAQVIISKVSLRGGVPTENYQNFEMYAGDSKLIEVTVADINLTGTTIKWVLKRSVKKPTNEVLKTTTSGITITDPTEGVFQIKLDALDTVSLRPGFYYHEAEVTDVMGNVSTVMTGRVRITASGV